MKKRSRNSLRTRIMLLGMAGLLLTSIALVVDVVLARLADSIQTTSAAATPVAPSTQRH